MAEVSLTPIWDALCQEWNVPPGSGVRGLITVIEGCCQPGAQMALEAPKPVPESPTAVLPAQVSSAPPARVITGEAAIRSTRKRPARTSGTLPLGR